MQRRWLLILAGMNLALLAALVWLNVGEGRAFAQNPSAVSQRYLAVAGEMQNELDAVYVVDTQERFLHVLTYDRGRRRLIYSAARDIDADIRNNAPQQGPRGGGTRP
jgi:hypothetical protein